MMLRVYYNVHYVNIDNRVKVIIIKKRRKQKKKKKKKSKIKIIDGP